MTDTSQPVVEGYPAAFAKTTIPDLEQVPNLVVVGATYDTGVAWSKTNREPAAGVPSVYAPGAEVNCADARHGGIKKGRGTSDGEFLSIRDEMHKERQIWRRTLYF